MLNRLPSGQDCGGDRARLGSANGSPKLSSPDFDLPRSSAAGRTFGCGGWILWLPGSDDEEVRGDPGVSDLWVGGGGLLVGAGLRDRLDDQACVEDGAEPPGEGPARVGDRERLVPVPPVCSCSAEGPC